MILAYKKMSRVGSRKEKRPHTKNFSRTFNHQMLIERDIRVWLYNSEDVLNYIQLNLTPGGSSIFFPASQHISVKREIRFLLYILTCTWLFFFFFVFFMSDFCNDNTCYLKGSVTKVVWSITYFDTLEFENKMWKLSSDI